MLKILTSFLIVNLFFHSYIIEATATTKEAVIRTRFNRLISRTKFKGRTGVYIRYLGGSRIYRYRSATLMQPASCVKIMTLGTALREMGEKYRFSTKLSGNYSKNTMTTPLYWWSNGDPSVSLDHLRAMVKKIKTAGITSIPKGVIIDTSWFTRKRPPGFDWFYGSQGYLTVPSPVALDGNTVPVEITVENGKPEVQCPLKSPFIKCTNNVRSGKRTKNLRVIAKLNKNILEITALGFISTKSSKEIRRVRVYNPELFAAGILIQVLRDEGIIVPDTWNRGKTPDKTTVLATHSSDNLIELVKSASKHSNNFWSENILNALGALKFSTPGNTQKGLKVVHAMLARSGIGRGKYILSNGSGLFGKTMVSPYTLVSIMQRYSTLKWLHKAMIDSMARPGKEGTLGKRLTEPLTASTVYAKTGTLNSASCLAGYVINKNKTVLFAIINDQLQGGKVIARKMQDEMVITLAKLVTGRKITTNPPRIK